MSEQKEEDIQILPEDFQNYELSFKIIVIGDSGVGKSCLTMKATKNYFENYYSPTVGFEFFTFNVKLKEKNIRLQIWDTCGQEVYRSLISSFYKNSSLAILVYSIEERRSYENLEVWLNQIREQGNPGVKIILVGNKNDLEEKREVSLEEGKKFCKDFGLNNFFETSAKTGSNAQNAFIEAVKILYEENLKYKERANKVKRNISNLGHLEFTPEVQNNLIIDDDDENRKKRKKCC